MGPRARLFMPSNAHRDFQVFDFECVLRHLVASNLRCEVSNPSLSAINKKGQTHSLTPFFLRLHRRRFLWGYEVAVAAQTGVRLFSWTDLLR